MKNGFTLIELLAVIIILAIVALIATPIILDVIEDSRKSANKSQVELLLDGLEQLYANNMLVEDVAVTEKFKNEENVYDLINTTNEKPADGLGKVNNEGKTAIAVTIDGLCYYKGFDDSELTIKELAEGDNCLLPPGAGEYLYQCKYYDFWKHEANSKEDFSFNSSTGQVIRYIGTDIDVIIPCEIDGVPVTSVGDTFFAFPKVTVKSAIFSDNIITIGNSFTGYTDIKEIILPSSVKTIGNASFYGLEKITLNEGLETIGTSAFANGSFTEITIPNSVKTIGINAFYGVKLTKLVLGSGVETILSGAFEGNNIIDLVIPGSVKEIGTEAFRNLDNTYKTITFEEGNLTSLSNKETFFRNNVQKVVIPSSLTFINSQAFGDYPSGGNNNKINIGELIYTGRPSNNVGDSWYLEPNWYESVGKITFQP